MFPKPLLLFITVITLFISAPHISDAQVRLTLKDDMPAVNPEENLIEGLKLVEPPSAGLKLKNNIKGEGFSYAKKQFNPLSIILYMVFLPNPMALYEDKRVYFGITKQASVMLYAAEGFGIGRLGFEYSFIINKDNPHHLRGMYIQDVVLSTGSFSASILSFEGGYFSDTEKKGISAGAGFSIILGFIEYVYVNPYLKLRHTFMFEDKPGITDLSLGVGLGIMFRD